MVNFIRVLLLSFLFSCGCSTDESPEKEKSITSKEVKKLVVPALPKPLFYSKDRTEKEIVEDFPKPVPAIQPLGEMILKLMKVEFYTVKILIVHLLADLLKSIIMAQFPLKHPIWMAYRTGNNSAVLKMENQPSKQFLISAFFLVSKPDGGKVVVFARKNIGVKVNFLEDGCGMSPEE